MLSVITAVHNQIGHNKLFLEGLNRYTRGPYEIIIVDNHSTDGSAELFEASGCRVIRNTVNLCYPESMNLGIRASKGDYLCLLNNDVYVGPDWDRLLIDAIEKWSLDAVSPLGLEQMPTRELTDWMYERWAVIGRSRHSGKSAEQLYKMIRVMYGQWENFCREIHNAFYQKLFEGIIGSCVMVRRSLLDTIGLLDERIQSADWDLYYKIRKREEEVGDVHRVMIAGWVYIHHFIRATIKGRPEPFSCKHPRLTIDEKWTREEQARLWYKPWDFTSGSAPIERSLGKRAGHRFAKMFKKVRREIMKIPARLQVSSSPNRVLEMYKIKFKSIGNKGF